MLEKESRIEIERRESDLVGRSQQSCCVFDVGVEHDVSILQVAVYYVSASP